MYAWRMLWPMHTGITIFFFPSHLLSSPFFSLFLLVVTQIRGHIAGSSPPLHSTARASHFTGITGPVRYPMGVFGSRHDRGCTPWDAERDKPWDTLSVAYTMAYTMVLRSICHGNICPVGRTTGYLMVYDMGERSRTVLYLGYTVERAMEYPVLSKHPWDTPWDILWEAIIQAHGTHDGLICPGLKGM